MSNVKDVRIIGRVPFHLAEYAPMCKFLGQMNTPVFDIEIQYGKKVEERPNEHGGKTAFYAFTIQGREAVSCGWIELLLQSLVDCGGDVQEVFVVDVENNHRMTFPVPEKSGK